MQSSATVVKMSLSEIDQLEKECYELINDVQNSIILDKELKDILPQLMNTYSFLYKKSDQLFRIIIRDFNKSGEHNDWKKETAEFKRNTRMLFENLRNFNKPDTQNSESHFAASRNHEQSFRSMYFPKHLRD